MRYGADCFQLHHLRALHIFIKKEKKRKTRKGRGEVGLARRPGTCKHINRICPRPAIDCISLLRRCATTKAVSLLCPPIAISYGPKIEYRSRYETPVLYYQAVEDV